MGQRSTSDWKTKALSEKVRRKAAEAKLEGWFDLNDRADKAEAAIDAARRSVRSSSGKLGAATTKLNKVVVERNDAWAAATALGTKLDRQRARSIASMEESVRHTAESMKIAGDDVAGLKREVSRLEIKLEECRDDVEQAISIRSRTARVIGVYDTLSWLKTGIYKLSRDAMALSKQSETPSTGKARSVLYRRMAAFMIDANGRINAAGANPDA